MKEKRVKTFFTLSEKVNEKFEKFIEKNYINKSKLIEGLIVDFLEKKDKENE